MSVMMKLVIFVSLQYDYGSSTKVIHLGYFPLCYWYRPKLVLQVHVHGTCSIYHYLFVFCNIMGYLWTRKTVIGLRWTSRDLATRYQINHGWTEGARG